MHTLKHLGLLASVIILFMQYLPNILLIIVDTPGFGDSNHDFLKIHYFIFKHKNLTVGVNTFKKDALYSIQ